MKFLARNWHLAWVIYSYLEDKSITAIKCANFYYYYWNYFGHTISYYYCATIYF